MVVWKFLKPLFAFQECFHGDSEAVVKGSCEVQTNSGKNLNYSYGEYIRK